jgi:hypothetical protein
LENVKVNLSAMSNKAKGQDMLREAERLVLS